MLGGSKQSYIGGGQMGNKCLIFRTAGKSMAPCREMLFFVVPPGYSLVSVLYPWWAFWADTTPFKRILWAASSPEIHRDTKTPYCVSDRRRSQDSVKKNNWRKLWLNICKKNPLSFLLLWKLRGRGVPPLGPLSYLPFTKSAACFNLRFWNDPWQ